MEYSPLFEKLWNTFDSEFGAKGSKPKAYNAFNKLRTDVEEIISSYQRQLQNKKLIKHRGGFTAPFQHVERYLRNERWRDDPEHIPANNSPGWKDYEKPEDTGRTLSPEEKKQRIKEMREAIGL